MTLTNYHKEALTLPMDGMSMKERNGAAFLGWRLFFNFNKMIMTEIQQQTVALFDKIIDAYIGGYKSWEAKGNEIRKEAERLKEMYTQEYIAINKPVFTAAEVSELFYGYKNEPSDNFDKTLIEKAKLKTR